MKKWVRTNPTDFTNDKLRRVFDDFLDYLRTLDDDKGAQYARFLTQSLEGALQEQVRARDDSKYYIYLKVEIILAREVYRD